MDDRSRRWVEGLHGDGAAHDAAVADLHELMLRAATLEVRRRAADAAHLSAADREEVARRAAADAVVGVLGHLGEFRGESRFTTWAYRFALREVSVALRRREWRGRELPPEDPEALDRLPARGVSPHAAAVQREVLGAVREAIDTVLTPHQRTVFCALALNEVPLDVLTDRLGSSRGALYKTLHDARARLRREVTRRGLALADTGADQ